MENYHFTRSGNRTLCWYNVKPDLGFVGVGEHENEDEARRLAYEDAYQKAHVISMKQLSMYHRWKQQKQRGY